MMKNVRKLALLGLAATLLFSFGACSKYKGFKKSDSGIYYKFFGDIHDTAPQPGMGGFVTVRMCMRTTDSVLIPMQLAQLPVDSLYEGDLFEAFRMMHVGDSATFILDGPLFYEYMMGEDSYPFGEEPLYFDVKLLESISKAEIDEENAKYEALLDERKIKEIEEIDNYLQNHPGMKQTPQGLYVKTVKKGNGPKVEMLNKVSVHYTGKFIDGQVFDNSVERGEPFTFNVGASEVIPGWDAIVSEMKVGDKVTVLIPSAMAYGASRPGLPIPPYSPLVFDIELLEIVKE